MLSGFELYPRWVPLNNAVKFILKINVGLILSFF